MKWFEVFISFVCLFIFFLTIILTGQQFLDCRAKHGVFLRGVIFYHCVTGGLR